jgi:hypothetical protein
MSEQTEKEPTRDEVIAWYKQQIELAGYRTELAELQARAMKAEAERAQATMILAQLTAGPSDPAEKESPTSVPSKG